MGEVNGWVTHTALAIRDEDELEVAASLLDAALRRAKAEGVREARARIEHAFEHGDIVQDVLDDLDARAAKIEEGE